MGQDKQDLAHLLNFIRQLYADKDNKEFISGIQELVLDDDRGVEKNINEIRTALQLRGSNSISYSFVKEEYVRKQLLVDNLRMENAALNLTLKDAERFKSFCINAFLQVENLLNYYYITTFKTFDDALSFIEKNTVQEKYPFRRNDKMRDIKDVNIYNKIAAFCNVYFPYSQESPDYTSSNIQALRIIRNDAFHRPGIMDVMSEADDKNLSHYQTEAEYRASLMKLVSKVADLLKQ